MNKEEIINKIEGVRKKEKKSIFLFSKEVGLSRQSYTNFVNGGNITIDNLLKIVESLNLKIKIS